MRGIRAHIAVNRLPMLSLASRPFIDVNRDLVVEICQEFDLDPRETGLLTEEE